MEPVLSVEEVKVVILKSDPPQWQVSASGTASTPGWTNPELVVAMVIGPELPEDGIIDLIFMAEPPQGTVRQVLEPISGYGLVESPSPGTRGVRVKTRTNSLESLVLA